MNKTITVVTPTITTNSLLVASKFIVKLTSGLFAGGNLYCTLVEHASRSEVETRVAAEIFPKSFARGATLQMALSSTAIIASFYTYMQEKDQKWLTAGLITLSILPYTYIVIMPVVEQLTDPNLDKDNTHTVGLLNRWGAFHSVRTLLSLASFVLVILA
jgi:hypothetical protein